MSQDQPTTPDEFANISGVGKRKLEKYGQIFTTEIRAYREDNGLPLKGNDTKQTGLKRQAAETPADSTHLSNTQAQTLAMYQAGLTPTQIAQNRSLKLSTIMSHLSELIELEEDIVIESIVPPDHISVIFNVINQLGAESLGKLKETLGESFSYDEIKLVRAKWLQEHS